MVSEKCEKCGGPMVEMVREGGRYVWPHKTGGVACLERQLAQAREREAALQKVISAQDEQLLSVGRERDTEKSRRGQAEAAYRKAMLALEGLTPNGSEYVGDPERCAEYVRDQRTHLTNLLKKTIIGRREEKARADKAEADLKTNAGLLAHQTDLAREAEIGKVQAGRLREAFRAAVFCPKGTLPKGYEDLWDGAWGGG